MRCEVMDHTGSTNVFNDQAEEILGCTADGSHSKSGDKAYDITLKNALLVRVPRRCHAEGTTMRPG